MTASKVKTPLVEISSPKVDLRKTEPPMVDIKVANPVTYLKSWWKKILGNEGVDFRFKVRPLTAIAISIIVVTVSMGIGRFVLPFKIPFFEFTNPGIPLPTNPTPSPQVWRETAFTGELQYSVASDKYFLLPQSSEAIALDIPDTLDAKKLLGKRIFAAGIFNDNSRLLKVSEVTDMELLPSSIKPVPTLSPDPSPTTEPSILPSIQPSM